MLAQLIWSIGLIEQSNCDPTQLARPEMRNQVMEMVDRKLIADGKDPYHNVKFYQRIQSQISHNVELKTMDKRDDLRALWLTNDNQKRHYDNWEELCVELEFARWPKNKEKRSKYRNIKKNPGQAS